MFRRYGNVAEAEAAIRMFNWVKDVINNWPIRVAAEVTANQASAAPIWRSYLPLSALLCRCCFHCTVLFYLRVIVVIFIVKLVGLVSIAIFPLCCCFFVL